MSFFLITECFGALKFYICGECRFFFFKTSSYFQPCLALFIEFIAQHQSKLFLPFLPLLQSQIFNYAAFCHILAYVQGVFPPEKVRLFCASPQCC